MLSGLTYIGTANLRRFSSYATPSIGSPICKYGKTTGPDCVSVTKQNIYTYATVPTADGGGTYSVGPLMGVTGHITDFGDSGGPWFCSTTGYGVHHGVADGNSAFSVLPNGLRATGVTLWFG